MATHRSRTWRRRPAETALACLLLLAGCGGSPRTQHATAPSAGATPTTSTQGATGSATSPGSAPATPADSSEPRPPRAQPTSGLPKPRGRSTDLSDEQSPGFTLPSGNIGCLFEQTGDGAHVRCDRRTYTGTPPPPPQQCQGDWGHSVGLTAGSRARPGCITDTVLGLRDQTDGSRPLRYGDAVLFRGIACTSTTTGVRCSTSGGHGFLLSRSTIRAR